MKNPATNPLELSERELAALVMDMFHRTSIHHALWFYQVEYQLGMKRALELLTEVRPKSLANQLERLGEVLGFAVEEGIPAPLLRLPRETLLKLLGELGKNWLAGDGIWFQAVEKEYGIGDAKRCNDSCWGRFSPLEAWSIKDFLGLPARAGTEGLARALQFRLYSQINLQTIREEGPGIVVLEMNECRVQVTRKRKGLPDYPCKSAGIVEYRSFAETIDERFRVECIGCPPDDHPEEWFCSWRFTLVEGKTC
ncbi:MAG: DUF6125 family protein [Smithellaceae bacterium]|nr:DUF6125 family protein [Smithellaceae bacterium]